MFNENWRSEPLRLRTLQATAVLALTILSSLAFAGDQLTPRDCILIAMMGLPVPPECGLAGGPDDPPGHPPPHTGDPTSALEALAKAVAPFHSIDVAKAAGWDVRVTDCFESPEGGMGYHYANLDYLLDGGKLSLLTPEALLYAPAEDGSMEFVAVEYVIPDDDWPFADPPEFPALGRHLHFLPGPGVWALHVWIARHNPAGIFEDWNPEVNCDFAVD